MGSELKTILPNPLLTVPNVYPSKDDVPIIHYQCHVFIMTEMCRRIKRQYVPE